MSKEGSFGCTGCGICCTNVGKVLENAKKADPKKNPVIEEFLSFPYKPKEDGSCEMLMEDGKCRVYEDRPLICNVEQVWEKYHQDKMTKNQYFSQAARKCNEWIKTAELPQEFLVNEQY